MWLRVLLQQGEQSYKDAYDDAGFYLLGGRGGKILPQTLQPSPQNFCQLNLTKSNDVLAKNLSAIPQLLRPQNCLRMPQNHAQKAQNSKIFLGGGGGGGGMPPDPPRELRPMAATSIHYHFPPPPPPKPNILDRTL